MEANHTKIERRHTANDTYHEPSVAGGSRGIKRRTGMDKGQHRRIAENGSTSVVYGFQGQANERDTG